MLNNNFLLRLRTDKIKSTPVSEDTNINNNNGISVLPGTSINPATVERTAPPAIEMDPPKPEAAPAKCGRTDSIQAVALGIHNPLPKPTKTIKPKKLSTVEYPKYDNITDKVIPISIIFRPCKIIASIPKRTA